VHVRKDKDHDKRMSVVMDVFMGKDSGCMALRAGTLAVSCWRRAGTVRPISKDSGPVRVVRGAVPDCVGPRVQDRCKQKEKAGHRAQSDRLVAVGSSVQHWSASSVLLASGSRPAGC